MKIVAASLRSKDGRRIAFSLLLLPLLAFRATAQNAPTTPPDITLGQSIVALNGPWKFHIGDNPQWADPNFNDSQWETVDLTPKAGSYDPTQGFSEYVPGWTAKGHPGYWGYAWYRIRVRVEARSGEKLAIAGPAVMDDAYQVFANGTLLGSFGKFPGPGSNPGQWPVAYTNRPEMFPLPESMAGGADSSISATGATDQVLAFRVWMVPTTLQFAGAGGFHSAPRIGSARAVASHVQLARLAFVRSFAADPANAVLFFLLAIVASSLVLFDRSDPVYLWLAAVFLLIALWNANAAIAVWTQIESGVTFELISAPMLPLTLGTWVMVWWVWFRLRHPVWLPKAVAGLTLLLVALSVVEGKFIFAALPPPVEIILHIGNVVCGLLLTLALVWIVIRGIRKQGREGWLALPAVVLVGLAVFSGDLHLRDEWFPFGIGVSTGSIAYAGLAAAIFVLLLRRLMLSIRHQREMALDVKQAQEVQQVLIPQELPRIPGLTIESEYRPAREVGGDFFQIIPHPSDGSVLIVAGDVTGHGLQAGMLVALLVGAIRNQTETSFDPLQMLQSLNRRLCGRGHAHATCLGLRVAADGSATLANAGHLPPYLNGKELPMPGALPLGMIEDAEFSLLQFRLEESDRLVLLSDGVAEAQDEHGSLFGFERAHDLLQKSLTAAEIATAAQKFGQQDDISVLSVTRLAPLSTAVA